MKTLICYFDGACEPRNPGGNMGLGACIFSIQNWKEQPGIQVFCHSEFMEADLDNSNNVAEYFAFEKLLDWLKENSKDFDDKVYIYGDSALVINQMSGAWKMNRGYYIPIAKRCQAKLADLKEMGVKFVLSWVPRQKNSYADELSKREFVKRNIEMKLQRK
jgi:ribonuclease HI